MLTALTAALVYGLTGGLTPGPLLTFVLRQTLRHGAREGIRTSFAPLITDGPIAILLLLLLDRIARVRPLFGAIAVGGVLYILYLAWESWTAPRPAIEDAESAQAPKSFLRGAVVNFLNPNAWMFWLTAGTPMLLKAWRHSAAAAVAFVVVFFVCLIGSKLAIVMLLARSRERVIGQWYTPAMRALALMLVGFAAVMARDAVALLRG